MVKFKLTALAAILLPIQNGNGYKLSRGLFTSA